jgi:O-antigen/teichoic acid export membrane protein
MLVVWLQPVIADLSRHTRKLFVQAREYGFHIYVGRVLSIGTYNMDVLMLAALTNARAVGLYSLAGAVAAGLGLPMNAFASVLFRRMVQSERLDRRWLALSWSVGAVTVVGAAALGGVVLRAVFSGSYAAAASLLVPLTMAEAMRGTTGLYNSFLTAHARGRELRNAGLVLTISNVLLNFALIPPFGAAGAAWASVLALVANLGAHMIGYRRVVGAPRGSVEDLGPTPERVTPVAP